MTAYFNLNNNKISKELLVNKFNMILVNQCRHVLNDQIIICHSMIHRDLLCLFRSSHWRCSIKKGVLTNFVNFTGKHLSWNLFLIKLQAFETATLLKRNSNTGFSCQVCEILKNTYLEEHLHKTASICFT